MNYYKMLPLFEDGVINDVSFQDYTDVLIEKDLYKRLLQAGDVYDKLVLLEALMDLNPSKYRQMYRLLHAECKPEIDRLYKSILGYWRRS